MTSPLTIAQLQKGEADVILLAREFLRNADFVLEAADELDTVISVPAQYQRCLAIPSS